MQLNFLRVRYILPFLIAIVRRGLYDKFNARNPFALNKPPYYERTIDGNISGPVIRDRLSLNFTVSDNKKENVGTVKAELPTGPFSLGVTRPTLNRSYDLRSVLQLADAHSLNMDFKYATVDSKNENVGDFVLPDAPRARKHRTTLSLRLAIDTFSFGGVFNLVELLIETTKRKILKLGVS